MSGKTRPKNKGIYPVYGGNGILDYAQDYNIDEPIVVVGRVGAYCGNVFYENKKIWLSDNALGIRATEKTNIKYLYYLLENLKLNKKAIGGAQPLITQGIINEIEIPLPPLPEQRAIAAVLSSFDDQIELLHSQNQTLEKIAQTLFKEWFTDFNFPNAQGKPYKKSGGKMVKSELGEIPEGWEVGKLGDSVDVKRGGSPRPIHDYIAQNGFRWLKISDATATDSPFIIKIKEHIKTEGINKTVLLKAGTLVLSNSATPGIPKILAIDSCIHDGWLHFPKSKFSNEFLYLLFKTIRTQLIQQGSGSVFTNLKTDILKDFILPIADNETLKKFNILIKPLFRNILNNCQQIHTLSELEVSILPKIMKNDLNLNIKKHKK